MTIELTVDHGVAPVPEAMAAAGFPSGRISEIDIKRAAEDALDARLGAHEWVLEYAEPYLYLSGQAPRLARVDPAQAQAVAARAVAGLAGVYNAYPRARSRRGAWAART